MHGRDEFRARTWWGETCAVPTDGQRRARSGIWRCASPLTCLAPKTRESVVPVMPAEDFSFFGQQYPSVMMWLGAYNDTAGATHPLHSAKYVLDENVLTSGVALHSMYALEYLRNGFHS